MGICRVCTGPTPPRFRTCATCSLLCPKCWTRLRNKTGYCSKCYHEHREPLRRTVGERASDPVAHALIVNRRKLYNKYSKRACSGTLERQPCAECGKGGKTLVYFNDYPNSESFIWLCRDHHRLVRPRGGRTYLKKKAES